MAVAARRLAGWIVAVLLALPTATVVAQEDEVAESALQRVLRDQSRIGLRVESLRENLPQGNAAA